MRSRFPALWILQLFLLLGIGLAELVAPMTMLELDVGKVAAVEVEWPEDEINRWVTHLAHIPKLDPTSESDQRVIGFFRELRPEIVANVLKARAETPGDVPKGLPISRHITEGALDETTHETPKYVLRPERAKTGAKESAEPALAQWDAVVDWILAATPAAKPGGKLKTWFRAVDQARVPPPELIAWVVDPGRASDVPIPELKIWIQGMNQVGPVTWTLAADSVRQESAYILAAAVFTLLGLLNPLVRRRLARIFTFIFIIWTIPVVMVHAGDALFVEGMFEDVNVYLWFGLLGLGSLIAAYVRPTGQAVTLSLFAMLVVWWGFFVVRLVRLDHQFTLTGMAMVYSFSALVLVNAYYWLVGKREDPPQDDAGIAQGRPPQLWTLWFVQFILLAAVGLLVLFFPEQALRLFTKDVYDQAATDLVIDQTRVTGSWILAMALFSFFSLSVTDDRTWRAIGSCFCVTFLLFALSNVVNIASGEYSVWAYAFAFQGLVFIPFTARLLKNEDPWFLQNVEVEQDYLTGTGLYVATRMTPWLKRQRGAFRCGAALSGDIEFLPERTDLPELGLFERGRRFPVHARFANRCRDDDAAMDVRGAAIRIFDERGDPMLDLVFATGSFAPVSNLLEFRKVLSALHGKGSRIMSILTLSRYATRVRGFFQSHRGIREGFAAALRRAPASYAALTYYHQTTRHWLTANHQRFLVRFRLRPSVEPDPADIGFPGDRDLTALWQQERLNGESRPEDYLRREILDRFARGEVVSMVLDLQLHASNPDDTLEWYDATVEWSEDTHPWHPLARIELRDVLADSEGMSMRFDPAIHPSSLTIPQAYWPTDPRSLAAAQARVMRAVGKFRLWRRSVSDDPAARKLSSKKGA